MRDEINCDESKIAEILLPNTIELNESDSVFNISRDLVLNGDENKIICESNPNVMIAGKRNTIYGKVNNIKVTGEHNCVSGNVGSNLSWVDKDGIEHTVAIDGDFYKAKIPYCFDGQSIKEVVRNAKKAYVIKDKAIRNIFGEDFESGMARELYETDANMLYLCIDNSGVARWSSISYEDAVNKILRDRNIIQLDRREMIEKIRSKGTISGDEFRKLYGCCENGVRWFADRCKRKGYCDSFVCDNGFGIKTLTDVLTKLKEELIRLDPKNQKWIDDYIKDFG